MVKERKLYDVLGVTPMATIEQIRKAYKQKARKLHPDRNPNVDPELFKRVTHAHEVLSSEHTRALYDEGGEAALEGSAPAAGGGGGEGKAAGEKRGGAGDGNSKAPPKPQARATDKPKAENVEAEIKLDLEDLYNGNKTVQVEAGGGVHEVFVDKGMADGQKIVLHNKANNAPDKMTESGDVVITIKQNPHNRFRRDGPHLHMDRKILLSEALCGFEFELTHMDGRKLLVVGEMGRHIVNPGELKVVRGEGMPMFRNPYNKGNLCIRFEVEFPRPGQLDRVVLKQLAALLPSPPQAVSISGRRDVDEVLVDAYSQVEIDTQKREFSEQMAAAGHD